MQESVEEVDGQEAQVCEPLEEAFHTGVADLRDLAGVERLTEANVNIIFMETDIGSNKSCTHIQTQASMGDCWAGKYKNISEQKIIRKHKFS